MKKIIYLGMKNKPHEVFETVHIKNFKTIYQYKNNNGKEVMLKATEDNYAYYPPCNFKQYVNNNFPVCKKGELYTISILKKGYSEHYFELIEV
jgi:hypothetical protein